MLIELGEFQPRNYWPSKYKLNKTEIIYSTKMINFSLNISRLLIVNLNCSIEVNIHGLREVKIKAKS
jgi:hypothetical protein